MRNIIFCILFICFCSFHGLSIGGEIKTWSSQKLGVRFSYDDNWTETTSIQESKVVSINWSSKRSNDPVATCYLETFESEFGGVDAGGVHSHIEMILLMPSTINQ